MDERPNDDLRPGLRPTLFIALGDIGSQTCVRLRERLLAAQWKDGQRIERIADLPLTRFMRFHRDDAQVWESGLAPTPESPRPAQDFTLDEIISGPFDASVQLRSSHVQTWCPLTQADLDAGPEHYPHLRAYSRLYFQAQADQIRIRLREVLQQLQSCKTLRHDDLQRLGLRAKSRVNVVIIASGADSIGSGSFIDMGRLVKEVLAEQNINGTVTLHFVLAGIFERDNREQAQAQTYASLMELDADIRGQTLDGQNSSGRTFDEVLLLDHRNLAQAHCEEPRELAHSLADRLFNDFAIETLSFHKEHLAEVDRYHTIRNHSIRLPEEFGDDAAVYFPRAYSSAGQAELVVESGTDGHADLHLSGLLEPLQTNLLMQDNGEDSLHHALAALSPEALRDTFSRWLAQALPWVELEPCEQTRLSQQGFRCIICVPQAQAFEKRYRNVLAECIPAGSDWDARWFHFLDSPIPGRLTCFTRLSGFALGMLSPLPDYLTSYNNAAASQPLHTDKRFRHTHSAIWTQAQYITLARDLRLYLQAVALGILTRQPSHAYHYSVDANTFSVGDEFSIRRNGLEAPHRQALEIQVQQRLSNLKPAMLAALDALFTHYRSCAYRGHYRVDERGVRDIHYSLPSHLSAQQARAFHRALKQMDPERADTLIHEADARLLDFTEPVEGSRADVYAYEVHTHDEKYRLREQCFVEGWLEALFEPGIHAVLSAAQLEKDSQPIYHLAVNGIEYGPYSFIQLQAYSQTGQITRQSLMWRIGLTQWCSAEALPELAVLFAPPSVPTAPPLPA